MLYALLGLAVLMIVHECGHYFVARAFGMRVDRFSIGFGPPIWRHQPKDSDTTFQVALIPFLAYVQIAGMNPFEENDPDDEGSYANASLLARISAIIAGPLANYFFASIVFFAALMIGGKFVDTTTVNVLPDGAAAEAGFEDGDTILGIDGVPVKKWEDIPKRIVPHAGETLTVELRRDGKPLTVELTPRDVDGKGQIGVTAERAPMPFGEAAQRSIAQPAMIVAFTVVSLGKMITGEEDGQLTGPIGIMRETRKAAERGLTDYLMIIGILSTSVGFFNMLPLPALDGGRLMFLGYEAITRRQPNQKIEAQIHMVGMLMLLTALVLVSFREWGSDKSPSEQAAERTREKAAQQEQKDEEAAASQADAP